MTRGALPPQARVVNELWLCRHQRRAQRASFRHSVPGRIVRVRSLVIRCQSESRVEIAMTFGQSLYARKPRNQCEFPINRHDVSTY
jgi:hypothetical protein